MILKLGDLQKPFLKWLPLRLPYIPKYKNIDFFNFLQYKSNVKCMQVICCTFYNKCSFTCSPIIIIVVITYFDSGLLLKGNELFKL